MLRNVTQDLELGRILWNDLKQQKMDMRFGTWYVKCLYRLGSLKIVLRELAQFKSDLVGVQEVRWGKGDSEPT
jgi:hypothetical protein